MAGREAALEKLSSGRVSDSGTSMPSLRARSTTPATSLRSPARESKAGRLPVRRGVASRAPRARSLPARPGASTRRAASLRRSPSHSSRALAKGSPRPLFFGARNSAGCTATTLGPRNIGRVATSSATCRGPLPASSSTRLRLRSPSGTSTCASSCDGRAAEVLVAQEQEHRRGLAGPDCLQGPARSARSEAFTPPVLPGEAPRPRAAGAGPPLPSSASAAARNASRPSRASAGDTRLRQLADSRGPVR